MSNRKAHRRPARSDRYERQIEMRRDRRSVWKLIRQWIGEISEAIA